MQTFKENDRVQFTEDGLRKHFQSVVSHRDKFRNVHGTVAGYTISGAGYVRVAFDGGATKIVKQDFLMKVRGEKR